MKTISLDHPVHVYFKDGECYHDSAAIMIANGFPSFVRGRGPDVIYPWENVKHIIRVTDESAGPEVGARLRASVAAIADERNGAKQETDALRAEVERLKSSNAEHRVALRDALGLTYDNHDHAGLCQEVKRIRVEWDHLSRYNSPEKLARLERRAQHDRDLLAKALGVDARDVDHGDLCARAQSIRLDLASVTEQRDVLKRQLEEIRADLASQYPNRDKPPPGFDISRLPKNLRMTVETAGVWGPNALAEAWRLYEEERNPGLPQPKQVDPGGPIWVRVVDTTSKYFGLVGRLVGIEHHTTKGECWGVDFPDLNGKDHAWNRAEAFVIIGTGRQGPGPNEAPKPDTEHQQAQNRDQWRATCLANGAKDCTVYFGPGDEVTFVVELKTGTSLDDIKDVLCGAYGFDSTNCKIREVRPIVDGVKPSTFKHPADNGQP